MRSVHLSTAAGLIGQAVLLGALAGSVGLGALGWVVGVGCGTVTNTLLLRGFRRRGTGPGPADLVTLTRATLVGAVAALVADSLVAAAPVVPLVGLSVVALALDAVDGRVARRTGTVSPLGGRFDMEVDAFLILVLSVYVSGFLGPWVLALGAARYALAVAERLWPWLRGPLPFRYWRKVVAAFVGVTLTMAAADVLPRVLEVALSGVAVVLLAESFGRDVWWRWQRSAAERTVALSADPSSEPTPRRTWRLAVARAGVIVSVVAVWCVLTAPTDTAGLDALAFARIPVEGLVFAVAILCVPLRIRRPVVVVAGVFLGLVAIAKVVDVGFLVGLGRPVDPYSDWSYVGSGVDLLGDAVGHTAALWLATAAAALAVLVLVLMPIALLSVSRLVGRHHVTSVRTVGALGAVWIVLAAFGVQAVPGVPAASSSAAGLAYAEVLQARTDLRTQQTFEAAVAHDPFRDLPGSRLLAGLHGKDVLIVFVESYGRVAVQDSAMAPGVDAVLTAGTQQLAAAGFSARSAFLTSPTFGGISWLAHSTLQAGVWTDSQTRYDELVGTDRFTLSDAFGRAGWRTVSDIPSDTKDWPPGRTFYHDDQLYDARNVGYAGPKFSYASMPDQYSLSVFGRRELTGPHPPVMAEIDLVSSHTPWAPLPRMVDPATLGDGSVFDGMPQQGDPPTTVWRSPLLVQAAYGQSIRYSLTAVTSFVANSHDDDLVAVVLGDHQPAAIVSGANAGHDVPVTLIAHDPAVLAQTAGWDWPAGLLPGPDAPVWRMDTFRDRFLTTFGSA